MFSSFRNSKQQENFDLHQFSSSAAIQEHYFRENKKAQENCIVIQWLQDSLEIPNEPADIRGTKWSHTKHNLKFNGQDNLSLISELDLDAPLRQKKKITDEDKAYEKSIHIYVFELLRARKYTKVIQFLKLTGNWSLLLSMKGITEYSDPDIEGDVIGSFSKEGIINKALWRRMCWQLAQSSNIDTYEKGIYGILSSDVDSLLPLSNTWELQLLTYLSSLVATESEEILIKAGKIDQNVLNIRIPTPGFATIEEILNALSSSTSPNVRQESNHVCRRYISDFIRNDLGSIVNFTAEYVQNFSQNKQAANFETVGNAIRTAVHLVLFLQSIGINPGDEQRKNYLIQTYIELLRSKGKSELTPLYVSYLPADEALDAYSFILAAIEDNNERAAQIDIANKYGLDIPNTIRRVVQRVFEENSQNYPQNEHFECTYEINKTDLHICKAAEWFYIKDMWKDCVHSGVSFYRMFLGSGKIQAAHELGTIVPFSNVLKHTDEIMDVESSNNFELSCLELKEYLRLVECLTIIESWNSHYASKPEKATTVWKHAAIQVVTNASDTVHDLCKTWMLKVINTSNDNETVNETSRIRAHYIPFLLVELLRIFVEAQSADFDFLKQGVNLATFVASDDYKLYELLVKSGTLNSFLEGLASACADGVIIGEKGIFE